MAKNSPKEALCATTSPMERKIRRFAGVFILASLLLAWKVDPRWLGLTAFVGVNLLQSSFTGFCPLENMLRALERRSSRQTATNP